MSKCGSYQRYYVTIVRCHICCSVLLSYISNFSQRFQVIGLGRLDPIIKQNHIPKRYFVDWSSWTLAKISIQLFGLLFDSERKTLNFIRSVFCLLRYLSIWDMQTWNANGLNFTKAFLVAIVRFVSVYMTDICCCC